MSNTRSLGRWLDHGRSVLAWSPRAEQGLYLFLAQSAALGLGLLSNVATTRLLGPADFGLYCMTLAAADYVRCFMNFGVFPSGARLLAVGQHTAGEQRRLLGGLLLLTLVLCLLTSLLVFAASFLVVPLLHAPIQGTLRLFSIPLGLLTTEALVEASCRGMGRIKLLCVFLVGSRLINLTLLVGLMVAGRYKLEIAVGANVIGSVAAAWFVLDRLRPDFAGLFRSLNVIVANVRTFGAKVYTGDLAISATSSMDSLLVSRFASPTDAGYYRLAGLLGAPLLTFSRSLSTVVYARFSLLQRIPARVAWLNAAGLCLGGVLLVALSGPVVACAFGNKYNSVSRLMPLIVVCCVIKGLSQPLAMFLAARGHGDYLRSASLTMALCCLAANFTLIPLWGVFGACYSVMLTQMVYLLLRLYYYRLAVGRRNIE